METSETQLEKVFDDLLEGLIKNHPRTPVEEIQREFEIIKDMTLQEHRDYMEQLYINRKLKV